MTTWDCSYCGRKGFNTYEDAGNCCQPGLYSRAASPADLALIKKRNEDYEAWKMERDNNEETLDDRQAYLDGWSAGLVALKAIEESE